MPIIEKPLGITLDVARVCVAAAARAYSEATFKTDLAQVLVIPATASMPMILAHRGSADPRAWLVDFQIKFAYTSFGRMHSGFWRSTGSVMPSILGLTPQPVIITGHSKGGGEAPACARQLAAAGWPIVRVVTFGGPRVGDGTWRTGYNGTCSNYPEQMADGKGLTLGDITERWVHEEDIVARVPVWLMGYRHVGHEYFLSSFGGCELNPPLTRLALSDIWGTFWGYKSGRIEQIQDHPVSRYLEHIAAL